MKTDYEFNEELVKKIVNDLGLSDQIWIENADQSSVAFVFYEISYKDAKFLWKKYKSLKLNAIMKIFPVFWTSPNRFVVYSTLDKKDEAQELVETLKPEIEKYFQNPTFELTVLARLA